MPSNINFKEKIRIIAISIAVISVSMLLYGRGKRGPNYVNGRRIRIRTNYQIYATIIGSLLLTISLILGIYYINYEELSKLVPPSNHHFITITKQKVL